MAAKKNTHNNEYLLTVNNKRIWEFYNDTKLNFEETNLIYIEMIEKTNILNCTKENTTIILNKIKEINDKIDLFQDYQKELAEMKENIIQTIHTTNVSTTTSMKNYMEELKTSSLKEISFENEKNTDKYFEKIKLHIYEFLPKNNTDILDKIQLFLHDTIKENNIKFLEETNTIHNLCKTIDSQVCNMDNKITYANTMITHIQDISKSLDDINERKFQHFFQNFTTFMKENIPNIQIQDLQNIQSAISQDMRSVVENQNLNGVIKSLEKSFETINNKISDNNNFIISNISQYNSLLESKLENNILKYTSSFDSTYRDALEKQKLDFQHYLENQLNQLTSSSINKDAINVYFNNIERKIQDMDVKVDKLDRLKQNSSKKGELSEKELLDVLLDIFRTASITRISFENKNCDILFKDEEDEILIENKSYDTNVPEQEVAKFKRDCIHKNTCGIMIQQEVGRGICGKQDFEFEIIQNNVVLLYIHSCNYSADKIKTAINIIKFFKKQLQRTNIAIDSGNESNITITSFEFDKLKTEYKTLIQKYNDSSSSLKSCIKVIKEELDKMANHLKTIDTNVMIELNNFFRFDVSNIFFKTDKVKCEMCNELFSRHGIAQHKKYCKKSKETLKL